MPDPKRRRRRLTVTIGRARIEPEVEVQTGRARIDPDSSVPDPREAYTNTSPLYDYGRVDPEPDRTEPPYTLVDENGTYHSMPAMDFPAPRQRGRR